ncbi:AroM family protein [Paenibacillus hubeiensis]|uniref:AroM family protein n=1 Tax=Paenibacillus hubeiensis TaxID=3077330 RepID=UPI0031BBBBB5
MKQLGMITIGQAPRTDVAPLIEKYLEGRAELVQSGVLDGLTAKQIAELAPEPGDYVLTSRLKDGSAAVVAREKIRPLLDGKIRELETLGIRTILLLCTGSFPGLHANRSHLIEPDRIIPPAVQALADGRRLGLIGPLPEQAGQLDLKFSTLVQPAFAAASPYTSGEAEFRQAVETLKGRVELILLDCMGYDERHREWVSKAAAGIPVILSNALMGKLVSETV